MRNIKYKEVSENYAKLAAPNSQSKMRPSIGMENAIGEFFYINVDNLEPYSKQARQHYDETELKNLAETIAQHGVTQPLRVIKIDKPGFYQVISGERRLRAAKIAGLSKVPCIITDDDHKTEEVAVIENIQRSDLHPIELSKAYNSLLDNYNYGDQSKLAKKLGVAVSHLSETLNYKKLPDEIKAHLITKNIRARIILRKLVALKNVVEMREALGLSKSGNDSQQIKRARNVLRISLTGESYKIEDRSLKRLSKEEKVSLKKELQKIIDKL